MNWPPSSLPATSRVQCSDTPQDAREASSSSGQPASSRTWSSTESPSRDWTWAWKTWVQTLSEQTLYRLVAVKCLAILGFEAAFSLNFVPWSGQQSPVQLPQGCECSEHAERAASWRWKSTLCLTGNILKLLIWRSSAHFKSPPQPTHTLVDQCASVLTSCFCLSKTRCLPFLSSAEVGKF